MPDASPDQPMRRRTRRVAVRPIGRLAFRRAGEAAGCAAREFTVVDSFLFVPSSSYLQVFFSLVHVTVLPPTVFGVATPPALVNSVFPATTPGFRL
jgi:hypothetical protein